MLTECRRSATLIVLVAVAILAGLALRTPTPQPADYCSNGNHITITTADAHATLNAPECR